MTERDDELTEAVRELTRTVDELREELQDANRRPGVRDRPPFPRPPSPRELLRVTDEVAIPALLAGLEASVRALEAFQRGLRLVRTERRVRDRTEEATDDVTDRASSLRRTTLAQLDTVLEELQRAASDGALSADDGTRDLLAEARELRDDVDQRLRRVADDLDTADRSNAGSRIEIDVERPDESADGDRERGDATGADAGSEGDRSTDATVDVDAELETLKDQYAPDDETPDANDDDPETDENRDTDGSGDDGDDSGGGSGDDGGTDGDGGDTDPDNGDGDGGTDSDDTDDENEG